MIFMQYLKKLRKQFENWKFKKILRKKAKQPIVVSQKDMMNGPLVITYCSDDACEEPSKKLIGWGSRILTKELIQAGIGKHVNFYACDKCQTPTECSNRK